MVAGVRHQGPGSRSFRREAQQLLRYVRQSVQSGRHHDGRRRQLPAVVESHDEPGSARAAVDARDPGGFHVTDVPLLEPLPVAHEHVARDRCQLRQLRLTVQAPEVGWSSPRFGRRQIGGIRGRLQEHPRGHGMPPTAHHLSAAPRTRGDVPLTALLGRLSRRRGAEYSISPPSRPADDWVSPVSSRWRAPGGIATGLLASRPAPTLRPPWTTPATAGHASGRTRTRLRSRLSQEPCRRVPKEPGRPAPARMSMPFEPGTASAQCAVAETFPELRVPPARLVRLADHRGTQGG